MESICITSCYGICLWSRSFRINFQLERSNAGYVFDKIDTGSKSVTVTFRGQPMYRGIDVTYYIPDPEYLYQHPPAPEAWISSDTRFMRSTYEFKFQVVIWRC